MKPRKFSALLLTTLLLTACGHLDMAEPAPEDRVLTGTVNFEQEMALPADAVAVVRVIDASNPAVPVNVLGETTLKNPGRFPIPFRIEYRADDEALMHQVRVEARISFGGKLRYHSVTGHPVTLGNVNDPHYVTVEATDGKW
jgi:uncharacterized lipoprotein YbaY